MGGGRWGTSGGRAGVQGQWKSGELTGLSSCGGGKGVGHEPSLAPALENLSPRFGEGRDRSVHPWGCRRRRYRGPHPPFCLLVSYNHASAPPPLPAPRDAPTVPDSTLPGTPGNSDPEGAPDPLKVPREEDASPMSDFPRRDLGRCCAPQARRLFHHQPTNARGLNPFFLESEVFPSLRNEKRRKSQV